MKIKLIAPANKDEDEFWGFKHLEKMSGVKAGNIPLALLTLAALTPKDIEVVIEDENIKSIDFDEPVNLVGISFFTCLAPRAYEIADEFRARGVKVVLGGIHASMMPDEAGEHADSVVIGEAEDLWPRLLKDFKNNDLQKIYKQGEFPDLQKTVIPRWDLVDINQYSYFTVQAGRGCPHACEFCSVYIFNGRKYRYKPIDNVLKEVELLKSIDPRKSIFFVDDNILIVSDYAKELFKKLIPCKIKWWCQASIDRLQDDEILDLMHQSGCREVFVGLESVSKESLEAMGKTKTNKVEEYEETIKKIHQHGIAVFGSFMFGVDADDEGIFNQTFDFIQKNSIAFAMLNIFVPTPGTVIHERLKKEERITAYDWSKYNGEQVCFKPKLITAEELQKGHDDLLKKVYSYDNIYQRLKNLWQMGVFVRDKQRRKLFTKGRVLFTFKIILASPFDIKRNWFVLRSLWNSQVTSIMSLVLALNFHDYSYKKQQSK